MDEQIIEIKNVEAAIEAILFAAGYPVKYEKIAEVIGLDLHNTMTIIEHMSEDYNKADSVRGLNLLLFPDTCQLSTKEQFAPYIREALGIRRGGNLSASSLEVLVEGASGSGFGSVARGSQSGSEGAFVRSASGISSSDTSLGDSSSPIASGIAA